MKVHELIELLDMADPEAEVRIPHWESLTEGTVDSVEEQDDGSLLLSPTEDDDPV